MAKNQEGKRHKFLALASQAKMAEKKGNFTEPKLVTGKRPHISFYYKVPKEIQKDQTKEEWKKFRIYQWTWI